MYPEMQCSLLLPNREGAMKNTSEHWGRDAFHEQSGRAESSPLSAALPQSRRASSSQGHALGPVAPVWAMPLRHPLLLVVLVGGLHTSASCELSFPLRHDATLCKNSSTLSIISPFFTKRRGRGHITYCHHPSCPPPWISMRVKPESTMNSVDADTGSKPPKMYKT